MQLIARACHVSKPYIAASGMLMLVKGSDYRQICTHFLQQFCILLKVVSTIIVTYLQCDHLMMRSI